VHGSPRYATATVLQRLTADAVVSAGCLELSAIRSNTPPAAKAALVAVYKVDVALLAQSGWMTSGQAAGLFADANAL